MPSWRDPIIADLTAPGTRLLLAADPDDLLLDESVLRELQGHDITLLPFEDPIAFRTVYEERYRPGMDGNDGGDNAARLVVVVREDAAIDRLPYDLLRNGRRVSFGLAQIFPSLSYPVVRTLDHADIDTLYMAYMRQPRAVGSHAPPVLGESATRDFLLRYVFDIDQSGIVDAEDLLAMLLRQHYGGRHLTAELATRLLEGLSRDARFDGWPLDHLLLDRRFCMRFLQERWPLFLDRLAVAGGAQLREPSVAYMEIPGPQALPFDQADVRPYIDSLFLDGLLQPVAYPHADDAIRTQGWVAVGIESDPAADRERRIARLLDALERELPAADATYRAWLQYAPRWAELSVQWHLGSTPDAVGQRFHTLRARLDVAFLAWLEARYAGLYSQAALSPAMVHRIPPFLTMERQQLPQRPLALLVLDGMAMDQWAIVRDVLARQRPDLQLTEAATFAWIPTITPVSRQALFSGTMPQEFGATIDSTSRDEAGWTRWWTEHGLPKDAISYQRSIRNAQDLDTLRQHLDAHQRRAVGLVADAIDGIAHGMKLGMAGMHSQVRQWAEGGFLADLLDLLLDRGYVVYLTADHGNVEAKGMGRPAEGAIADTQGQRVRIYPSEELRGTVQARFPGTIPWPSVGLPAGYVPLLAAARSAFVSTGEVIVAHGGCALEEVIVPFVTIERRTP